MAEMEGRLPVVVKFRAERISAEDFDAKKILVTSGLGVKPYYRRLGYRDDGPYVSKPLR